MARRKTKNKVLLSICIFVAFVGLLTGRLYVNNNSSPDLPVNADGETYPFKVSVVDVGQGDCILISCGDDDILIDGGEREKSDSVLDYIKNEGIDKIELYVATHPHSDHIGASANILGNVKTDRIMMTSFSEENMPVTATYERFLDALADSKAEIITVTAGETYSVGEINITVLAPFEETDDYNDMSVVLKAVYKDTSFLFMGDASSDIEKQILSSQEDCSADVIKLGHHGSRTASSYGFLSAVSPSLAVISCGKDNSYGHPHAETLKTLSELNIEFRRTDTDGTVIIYSDGEKIAIGG